MKRFALAPFTVALGICVLASSGRALAHHAFAAEFDVNKRVTLEGTLTKVAWVNPHGWIYVDVEKDGKVTNWAVEFGSPHALLRRGLRTSDFPPGIKVIVKGFLAKNGSPTVNAESVTLPGGRTLFTGSSNPNARGAAR
ncbi:MAG: DUF6152 family protein [Vicinamibacteraceae bacterium]